MKSSEVIDSGRGIFPTFRANCGDEQHEAADRQQQRSTQEHKTNWTGPTNAETARRAGEDQRGAATQNGYQNSRSRSHSV